MTVPISRATPRRPSAASSAVTIRKPSVACVWATHQSSGTGGTTWRARSFLSSRFPTWGPLPCVITTSWPWATSSAICSQAPSTAVCCDTGSAPRAPAIALPPRATTTRTPGRLFQFRLRQFFRRPPCEHVFVPFEATILHADLDSFFASVEQRDDPRLRGKPVIVGAGVVLAASYEAKACGVHSAMGGRRARRLCPDAVVVSPRMQAYSEASKAVFEVFENTSPLVEGLSIDEAFIDVRGLRRISGTPAQIAARLRREVRERVGLPITIGVARTKFLAKVASGVAKPDGLLVVPPDRELAFLHPLPVERLWGVGAVTSRK